MTDKQRWRTFEEVKAESAREFREGYERLMADPEAWANYVRERDEWTDADLTDDSNAAEEYPEYNR